MDMYVSDSITYFLYKTLLNFFSFVDVGNYYYLNPFFVDRLELLHEIFSSFFSFGVFSFLFALLPVSRPYII